LAICYSSLEICVKKPSARRGPLDKTRTIRIGTNKNAFRKFREIRNLGKAVRFKAERGGFSDRWPAAVS
jgi:hypothetical protein